ncbi:DUF1028 domain-containing protein [Labrys monachus]|uniref:Ntn-hydrolase superfamily protein n=1 Tax=Labrys monachus TaxID=217067 RepID=A0ABU0F9S5_9HYPH|nr:DUF1028 domain-containing protein [Labrys monachus]MDQ0391340.1 putative Ntn-hydrolase superfamily protein [Labrys monachus]
MTWSILAHDPATGEFGAGIATKAFAVGAHCLYGDGRFGVLATQAKTNPLFGGRGLRLLAEDCPADHVLAMLLATDEGRDMRQLHVMDRWGHIAQHTGAACVSWRGSVQGRSVSVAGNMLSGPGVVEACRDAFLATAGQALAERLMAAMEAAEAAGGDSRGRESAALRIWKGEEYSSLDIRVDSHADPLAELRRLYGVSRGRFATFSTGFPTRADPVGSTDLTL